jgi:hypothetical protein
MTRAAAQRLTWYIVALGAIAVAAVYGLRGADAARSAGIGVVVAMLNWFSLRFIVGRVVSGDVRTQTRFALLLVVKMAAIVGVVLALIVSGWVEPIAFTIGVSVMAIGALLGSFAHVLTAQRPVEGEG